MKIFRLLEIKFICIDIFCRDNEKWLTSHISISDAKISDSGNYSCALGRLFTTIVQVQVLTGR